MHGGGQVKHATKRKTRRLREKRRLEELYRYTALCMQARMLCKLDERMQLMHGAMKVVEGLDLGAMTNSTRRLQYTLTMSGPALPYYLEDHWWAIARPPQIALDLRPSSLQL